MLNVNFQSCVWTDIVYLIVFSSCYDDRRDVSVFPLSVEKKIIRTCRSSKDFILIILAFWLFSIQSELIRFSVESSRLVDVEVSG